MSAHSIHSTKYSPLAPLTPSSGSVHPQPTFQSSTDPAEPGPVALLLVLSASAPHRGQAREGEEGAVAGCWDDGDGDVGELKVHPLKSISRILNHEMILTCDQREIERFPRQIQTGEECRLGVIRGLLSDAEDGKAENRIVQVDDRAHSVGNRGLRV